MTIVLNLSIKYYNCRIDSLNSDGKSITATSEQMQFLYSNKIQMKKFEERPIPLIYRNENKVYQVNPEALAFFQAIEGKIAVISVAGMYRTGKSYLLNTILLKQKTGFAVGPTTNPKTKGIWVWGKPLILKNEKDQIINVCVLDSQGLGSTQEDVNHDLRLFSLTLLLSSMFIYNTIGSIDEQAIDSLGLVLRLCERMKADNYNDFPDFYWVLRDFSLALVGRDNKPLTANKYLEQSLSPQAGDSEVRNKIRQSIRSSFENRGCFTFVRPLTNEEQLQKLDTMDIDQLRPEFTEQVIEFRRMINSRIRTKKIKGKEITSEMLIDLIKVYNNEINGQNLPHIQTGWKYVCARECEHVLAHVEKEAEEAVAKLMESVPTNRKQLSEKKEAIAEHLKKLFDSKTAGNDQASQFVPELSKILDKLIGKVQSQMRMKNAQETKAFIKRQFQSVERRLKSGEVKSMGELAKQFELFYQFYRKKCPYKDEIQIGLETIMKKFSDCSLVLFKTVKKRKEEENAKLKEDLDRLTQQQQSKEERHKHERNIASDKLAVLESKLEQITRQNKQLTHDLSEAELELEKLRVAQEDGAERANQAAEFELLSLRKKIMDAQDAMREIECNAQFEMNNLRNQLFLKENEISHFLEDKNELTDKITMLTTELANEKEERGRKIEELISASQIAQGEWQTLRKTFEERLSSREQQILRLESSLEAKAAELITLTQQHEKTLKTLLESHETQKNQLLEGNKDELRAIKEALQNEEESALLKIRKMEAQFSQKEMDLKMHRLQVDRQMAILNQKVEFIRKECSEKEDKIAKLQQQNACYLSMLEQKDNELTSMNSMLDQSRVSYESSQYENSGQLDKVVFELQEKSKQITRFEQNEAHLLGQLREKSQENKNLTDKFLHQTKSYEERIKELQERLKWAEDQYDRTKASLQEEIDALRMQNTKGMEEQKKGAELSLVQLKNYYEMEKQRLEKRNLEERKKHENAEASLTAELQSKHRKAMKAIQEELQSQRIAKQQLQQQLMRVESEWEIRMNGIEEERDNEQRLQMNKTELLERKYEQIQAELEQLQRSSEQERINYVKRIEGLNFDLSRKEKELLQTNTKKESLEQTLIKKESQVDSIKKLMNQQIESALKKVSDIQVKYQKLNEEYMQYKIESEKELALIKQKNEFQSNKLSELTKDKESGSNKNIERLDKQRFGDLKDQNEKFKAQILNLEGKIEAQRKAQREQETTHKKQYATLERDYEFLLQKETISQAKITELQNRLSNKSQSFTKQVDEVRAKEKAERQKALKEKEQMFQKLHELEEQKNQLVWNNQKETALQNEKIKYVEYQRDQAKKQLEESQKRLGLVTAQLRKAAEKASDDTESRKQQTDKKYMSQIEQLKENMRSKNDLYEQTLRKMREQLRTFKEKYAEQSEKVQAYERSLSAEKNLIEENENLRKQKENIMIAHRTEKQKEFQQWKRKNGELDRRNKQLEKANMDHNFQLEKDKSKWNMQRSSLYEKIKSLEDTLEWERNKSQLVKSKSELRKTESQFSFTATEYSKFSNVKK